MKTVAALFRHPIKGHGRQELTHVSVDPGQIFPFDRRWAVAHDASNIAAGPQDWAQCLNFSRGAKAPSLMAMTADLDETSGQLILNHPDLPEITFDPDNARDAARFIAWVQPIMPENRAKSNALVRANGYGMTDQKHPYISINTTASLADLSQKAGTDMSMHRFRGNIWLKNSEPWEEFNWIGKTIRIGGALLKVEDPIERCLATTSNPETGRRDVETLELLQNHWGHKDFGVFAAVIEPGNIGLNDTVEVL